jgi:hypothetical protein
LGHGELLAAVKENLIDKLLRLVRGPVVDTTGIMMIINSSHGYLG